MARGSFGGGGGGRGGFSGGGGGGRGGFSGGNKSSGGKSSFNNKSGGGLGGFIAGAIIGSILEGKNSKTTVNPATGQVFPDMGNQSLGVNQAPVPVKEPEYREFMKCDYCNAEYNDLTLTKCENCGASLKHQRAVLEDASQGASGTKAAAQPKKNNKASMIIVIVAVALVLVIIAAVLLSGSGDRSVMSTSNYTASYDQTYVVGDTINGDVYTYRVTQIQEVYSLSRWGITEQGNFIVVYIEITNGDSYTQEINVYDITVVNDDHLMYCCADMRDASENKDELILFRGRTESAYISIESGETLSGYLIFPVDDDDDIAVDIREYDGDFPVGAYLVEED